MLLSKRFHFVQGVVYTRYTLIVFMYIQVVNEKV
jgi:hypothetical protein